MESNQNDAEMLVIGIFITLSIEFRSSEKASRPCSFFMIDMIQRATSMFPDLNA